MKAKELPEEIYFEEKVGSNGIHCLDYKNESDVKYIRADLFNKFKKEIEKNKCEKCRYDFEDKDKPSPYHDVEKYYSTE